VAEMEKSGTKEKLGRAKVHRRVSQVLFYIFIAIALFVLYSPLGNLGTSFTIGVSFFALAGVAIIAMYYFSHQVKKFTKQSEKSA